MRCLIKGVTMYTVAELIATLEQCPADYQFYITGKGMSYPVSAVGIDHAEQVVEIFVED